MSSPTGSGFPLVLALRGGRGSITLHRSGLRHPRSPAFLGEAFTAYGDITHHTVTWRSLRLATRRSVYVYPRTWFEDPSGPDQLAQGLVEHIEELPGGREQLDRMWAVEKRAARPEGPRVAPALGIVCLVVFALGGLLGGERLFLAGHFSTLLVRAGEVWRVVSANLLHGGAGHLLLNVLGLLAIGTLVERVLGPWRTGLIAGVGGLTGMGAGFFFSYEMAVGASGIVFALVGALVWLELRCAAQLPAAWRVPRGLLLGALGGDLILSVLIPQVAGAAHLGGLLGGALACAVLAPGALAGRPPSFAVRAADLGLLFVLALSVSSVATLALREGSPLAPHALRLAEQADVPALTLNNFAWLIATDPEAAPEDLEVALRLAERAVDGTDRRDPNILDTLAEVQFAAGSSTEAVRTIDEAIALAPGERYFVEQRRRFAGERAPDDRPDPPGEWVDPRPDEREPERGRDEDPGIRT